jgi:hypothetical protein
MVQTEGQISAAELAAFADGSLPNEPTLLEIARLADRSPSAPTPSPDRAESSLLDATIAGVPVPHCAARLGWAIHRRAA